MNIKSTIAINVTNIRRFFKRIVDSIGLNKNEEDI